MQPTLQSVNDIKNTLLFFATLFLCCYINFATASIETNTNTILNWAEKELDQFPSHEPTQSIDPWLFRFYPKTGIYAGVNKNDKCVYVLGGEFGNLPLCVDTVQNLLKLALPTATDVEQENNQLSDLLKSIAQAESDTDLRPETGLWVNPQKPFSGVEIHLTGNQFILLWRTFDAKGLAIWYLAVGNFDGTKHWSADLMQLAAACSN